MKGDFTRSTFDPKKHYSSVRMQQGRVQLDSDWNEQMDIEAHLRETAAADVIGPCGVPSTGGGFKVGISSDGKALTLSAGRLWVDGILCELEKDQAVEITGIDGQGTATYCAYLDVWRRHVTALEDANIREIALGGPDTATRLQTVWQVKLAKVDENGTECDSKSAAWDKETKTSDGRLSARTQPVADSADPCKVPVSARYTRLENQLYRVEVHDDGELNQKATFKWSRENGSIVAGWSAIAGESKKIRVTSTGHDKNLDIAGGPWIELTDDAHELNGKPGRLVKVTKVEGDVLTLDFGGSPVKLDTDFDEKSRKARRWDSAGPVAIAQPSTNGGYLPLEGGIEIRFEPGTYKSGDYWLIPARAFIGEFQGDIEWPQGALSSPPHGIQHHYCKLAVVESSQGKLSFVADCREQFLPLTKLKAQETQAVPACCSFAVSSDGDWKGNLKGFLAKQKSAAKRPDVSVCFAPGTYNLTETLELSGLGNVKIEGAGAGTRIVAQGRECALRFYDCQSVIVCDLAAQSGVARSGKKTPERHLNGTLTFERCGPVTVSGATLQCAGGDRRAASCITVLGTPVSKVSDVQTGGVPVRIRSCELRVGRGQVGILVVDGQRIQIEDNNIAVVNSRQKPDYRALIQGRAFRSGERRQLLSALQVNQDVDTSTEKVHLEMKGHTVQFRTAKPLRKVWSTLLEERPLAESATANDVRNHFYDLADEILRGGPASHHPELQEYLTLLRENVRPVASQGIVIGGRQAGDVRILDNSVTGVVQGVHLGLSHRGQLRTGPADMAGRVRISNNRIVIVLATGARPGAHGIFLGSVDSAIVDGNHVQVVGRASTPLSIDGIRVFGWLGALLLVKHNHLVGCTTGVRVDPFQADEGSLWRISENVLVGGKKTVDAKNVAQSDNHP